MARSGSYNFALNGDQLIRQALIEAHIVDYFTTPDAPVVSQTRTLMNLILKEWQADGLHLWAQKKFTLLLEKDKTTYSLGATGDHATESYVETAIRVAGAATDTTLEVDSTTGITAGDYIGVELDDGTIDWTTVASITDSDTLELTAGLDSAAAVDNAVYAYTTKIQRPLRILEATVKDSSGNETTLELVSRQEYHDLSLKTSEASPNLAFFEPLLDNAKLYLYPEPDDVTDSVELYGQFPFDDMDAATDDLAFPVEWQNAVVLETAYRTACRFGMPEDIRKTLRISALESKERVMGFDTETTHILIQPEFR